MTTVDSGVAVERSSGIVYRVQEPAAGRPDLLAVASITRPVPLCNDGPGRDRGGAPTWEVGRNVLNAKLFGWAKSDAFDMGEMGTYLLFNAGGDAIGGMMNSPNFPRPAWLFDINVDDIDAAHKRLTAAGGQVLFGPSEVPGGGWIIQATDPQGAMFAIVGPRKS